MRRRSRGEWSARCEPGTSRVAPLASVKSVSAHIELQTVGGCGFGSGMSWSSAWIGCAVSPGWIAIDDSDEIRQPGSSTPLDDRQHVRVHRDPLEERAEREQVVDAQRVVSPRTSSGAARTSKNRSSRSRSSTQRVDEVGLDRVLDDRVALLGDRFVLIVRRSTVD